MNKLLLIACLSGCWGWGYGEGVDPRCNDAWGDRVAEAVQIWNARLYDKCLGPAFYIDEWDGHPVRRLTHVEWKQQLPDKPDKQGWYSDWDAAIYVLEQPSWPEAERQVLVHELGHALGLRHVDPEVDPHSVMKSYQDDIADYIPTEGDVANVECP